MSYPSFYWYNISRNFIVKVAQLVVLVFLFFGCKTFIVPSDLPPPNKPHFLEIEVTKDSQKVFISLINHLPVDRYLTFSSPIDTIDAQFEHINRLLITSFDTLLLPGIPFPSDNYTAPSSNISVSSKLGNPFTAHPDTTYSYDYPFPQKKRYRILQGFNGRFTHHKRYNRFAIDFNLAPGDTICAAREGVVGYLFESSKWGGNNPKFLPYANQVMIVHKDGTIAQYSHLNQYGALVEIGDTVKKDQPIGLSGNTGYVSGNHLHFNIMKPDTMGPISIQPFFHEKTTKWFNKGDIVSH